MNYAWQTPGEVASRSRIAGLDSIVVIITALLAGAAALGLLAIGIGIVRLSGILIVILIM